MLSDSDLDEICYHTEYTCGFSLTVIGAWAAAGQWNAVKIVQYSGYTVIGAWAAAGQWNAVKIVQYSDCDWCLGSCRPVKCSENSAVQWRWLVLGQLQASEMQW